VATLGDLVDEAEVFVEGCHLSTPCIDLVLRARPCRQVLRLRCRTFS
jgi:hypothetical protein